MKKCARTTRTTQRNHDLNDGSISGVRTNRTDDEKHDEGESEEDNNDE